MKTFSRIQLMLITLAFFVPNAWTQNTEKEEAPAGTFQPSAVFGLTLVMLFMAFDLLIFLYSFLMSKSFIDDRNATIADKTENESTSIASITITRPIEQTANTIRSHRGKERSDNYDGYEIEIYDEDLERYEKYHEGSYERSHEGYEEDEEYEITTVRSPNPNIISQEGYHEGYEEDEEYDIITVQSPNPNIISQEGYHEEPEMAAVQLQNPITIDRVSYLPPPVNTKPTTTNTVSSPTFVQFPTPSERVERGSDKKEKFYSFI